MEKTSGNLQGGNVVFRLFVAIATVTAALVSQAFALEPVDIYRTKSPAVVLIFAKVSETTRKGGTGFFINDKGLVMTNAHVITDKNDQAVSDISVYIKPAKVTGDFQRDLQDRHSARVLKFDRALDVALLQVDEVSSSIPQMYFADSDNVEVGQKVVAIGHPEQGGLWTLTSGAISARIKNLSRVEGKDMFQSDASINHGNSGGPLLDTNGMLVGMNTSTARASADGSAIVGINFALQSNVITHWLGQNNVKAAMAPQPAGAPPVAEKKAEAAPASPPPTPAAATAQASPPRREAEEKVVAQAKPAAKAQAPVAAIVTPPKPFEWNALEETIAEMEGLMSDMHKQVKKKFK